MCGVIGVSLDNPTEEQLTVVDNVMRESAIRGRHASGISYTGKHGMVTFKDAIPIDELSEKIPSRTLITDNKISMIAHSRYSTSDIHSHQPVGNKDTSIVLNGVISQEPRSMWEELYGYRGYTSNDASLLVSCIEEEKHPLVEFPEASIAACVLNKGGDLTFFRNGKRPLWYAEYQEGVIVASTRDILERSGVSSMIISKVEPFTNYTKIYNYSSYLTIPVSSGEDLQIKYNYKDKV